MEDEKPFKSGEESLGQSLGERKSIKILELDKGGVLQRRWVHSSNDEIFKLPSSAHHSSPGRDSIRTWAESCRRFLLEAFLPVGFPRSVSEDYLAYQRYDSLQAFFSTISGMLADRALLEGLGVGDANSTATYAVLLGVFKDITSRLCTIGFAQRFGLNIEPECKKYRFMADFFNDTAFFLVLASPRVGGPTKAILLACAEGLRAMCGVAGSASKAALSSHFALQDNMAELNAKEASQETAVGLIGLLFGTIVVKSIEDRTLVLCLMVALVLGHLYVNYLGVRCVILRTLNRQRATLVFDHWLRYGKVLTPAQISSQETILSWVPLIRNSRGEERAMVHFARDYSDFMEGGQGFTIFEQKHFKITTRYMPRPGLLRTKILLMVGAEPVDAIKAWFMAMEMVWNCKDCVIEGNFCVSDEMREKLGRVSLFDDPNLFEELEKAGWDVATSAMETGNAVRVQILQDDSYESKKDE
ncbi:hypothetical protein jhhlp_001575 [Lomentospora prolificans]|uniref:Protein root UVB sensitive/RUS domain-containing protein n=1 Tax=Lomentospora prolificans TaxID=41688 RepID=A0A2N3NIL0_9PEZI|nr:hypothetical protein jhhlp_001575 [Lomentospora prolificans]